jgi:predicted  nucleic acid-binding Zn-ribbon protein
MSQEETDLSTHVSLCHLRYQQLQEKIDGLEQRLVKVETTISTIKSEMHTGFSEIKLLLERQSNARTIQIIATAGTIIASIMALVGYILTH